MPFGCIFCIKGGVCKEGRTVMGKKLVFLTGLVVFLLAVTVGCAGTVAVTPPDNRQTTAKLTVTMLNVGQGDAILINTGSQKILLDTGDADERENLKRELDKFDVKTLDKVILTHPHADHIGGMSLLLKECEVKEVYDNGMPSTSPIYRAYMKLLKEKNIPRRGLKAGDRLDLGDNVSFTVISPDEKTVEAGQTKGYKHNPNNESVAGKLELDEFSMLFTGDMEKDMEEKLAAAYGDKLRAKVLKAPHHGSKTSSSPKFMQAVQPEAVLISLGKDNDYGHPHQVTLERYEKQGCKVYRTDQDGSITITTDGKKYEIKGDK